MNRDYQIEIALRDMREAVIDALALNPRMRRCSRHVLDQRLQEAMDALSLPPSRRRQPAEPAASELAEISEELRATMTPEAQTLADRLDAAAAKAKQELADAAALDGADMSALADHVTNLEAALATPAPTPAPAADDAD